MKMKSFGLTETKLFHFHRIFKNGEGVGRVIRAKPLKPPFHDHTVCLLVATIRPPAKRHSNSGVSLNGL